MASVTTCADPAAATAAYATAAAAKHKHAVSLKSKELNSESKAMLTLYLQNGPMSDWQYTVTHYLGHAWAQAILMDAQVMMLQNAACRCCI